PSGLADLHINIDNGVTAMELPSPVHKRTCSQDEKQGILLLVKVKHYLIRSHVRASYSLFLQMIGRFSIRVRLSLLVRLIVESSAQQQISELASARESLSLSRGCIFARDTKLHKNT